MLEKFGIGWRLTVNSRRIAACSFMLFVSAWSLGFPKGLAQTDQVPLNLDVKQEQIAGPASASDFAVWLRAMKQWRHRERERIHYNAANYARPQLQWAHRSFIQPQMMIEDRDFYDPKKHRYTVRKYLDGLQQRYGGIDSVLVWPTYPNIGIDDRNTDDMFRAMPGGIPAIKRMVQDFHKAGVRVLFPIHPWDIGTRDPRKPWASVLPKTMAQIGADGMNGDTMGAVTQDFFDTSLAAGRPLAFEPEGGLGGGEIDQLGWNVMGWGYWDNNEDIPMVSKAKWLEPRHMVNLCDRWSTDKTRIIQDAFFNGVGVETWENVWGIWNQMTDRDSEAVRRVATIERAFPDLLVSPGWEPHTPTIQNTVVFASKWPDTQHRQTLWTLVNMGNATTGEQISVSYQPGRKYYDLWHGLSLKPRLVGGRAILSFDMEPNGCGAVLATDSPSRPHGLETLLATMHRYAQRPLSTFSQANMVLHQKITPITLTQPATSTPDSMVAIPAAQFDFKVAGIEIEGEDRPGVDVQYPWETEPHRSHQYTVDIPAFYIDKYPVTNAQFQTFVKASHYKPADSQNFLKDWKNGQFPAGWADKPVTWVSLEDARAYAAWAGKRLPHEWEWQYAAQGTDGRLYPWGPTWDDSQVTTPDKERTLTPPDAVTASHGISPFGVRDLVGNVWQWTDEYTDTHTRAAILRGGSHYQPQGSMWYFPQAYRLDQHGKYLLMAPGRDRSGCIGFRCVKDR